MKKILLTTLLAATASVSADNITAFSMQIFEAEKTLNAKALKQNRQGTIVVTVGSTLSCNYNSGTTKIQDAIDSGADEVRIVNGFYSENIVIDDIDLTLKGNYASCADAAAGNQLTATTGTVINAASAGATIEVIGSSQRNSVDIDNIRVTGGTVNGFSGGGLTTLTADASISLFDVWISENTGILGGGISILAGDTDIIAYNLMVFNNAAPTGGGIFCNGNGGNNSVVIYGAEDNGFGIASNQATDGGGVYLNDGCVFTSFVGTSGGIDFRGILSNSATGNGGGIYATSGSKVNLSGFQECAFIFCFGNDTQPVSVVGNSADGNGGGIYATGANTVVNVFNGLIRNNEAILGGGVFVTDEAFFYTDTTFKKGIDCWSPGSCSQITGNSATASGGGLYVRSGAFAELFRTHIVDNRADFGTAFYTSDANSSIFSEGNLIAGNGDNGADGFSDNNVLRALNGGTIGVRFTTIADNNLPIANEVIANDTATTSIQSSIVHEPNDVALIERITPTAYSFDCVVVHERNSFPGGSNVLVADPQFVDRANGNYHINWMTSPAVDFCDDFTGTPLFTDIDNEPRGFDWPGIPNVLGGFDVGFDEQNDIIFANGFEDLN